MGLSYKVEKALQELEDEKESFHHIINDAEEKLAVCRDFDKWFKRLKLKCPVCGCTDLYAIDMDVEGERVWALLECGSAAEYPDVGWSDECRYINPRACPRFPRELEGLQEDRLRVIKRYLDARFP